LDHDSRKPSAGLLVHSDRGSQYASQAHATLLSRHALLCSMSRKGNCWGNAVMDASSWTWKWSGSGNVT